MIERVAGKLIYKDGSHVVIDVLGVGYGVDTTDGVANQLSLESNVSLWIYTDVRDDDIKLFGFSSLEERILFTHLISAPGVGAKLAMAMLSHLGAHAIVNCVLADDAERLKQVPGIAAKAKEIQLHLKRRLSKLEDDVWLARLMTKYETAEVPGFRFEQTAGGVSRGSGLSQQIQLDLNSALTNLGYKDREIQSTIKVLSAQSGDVSFSVLLRQAIAMISGSDARNPRANAAPGIRSPDLDEVF